MSDGPDPDLAAMRTMLRGFQLTVMVAQAAGLGLADKVATGPRPVRELAAEAGADPGAVLRLCRALAAFGVFALDADGRLSQTARSGWLRRDAAPTLHHAARYWASPGTWAAWGAFGHALRTGGCPFEAVLGQPIFDYLRDHADEAAVFDAFMRHSPDDRHAAVAEVLDLAGARLAVDVGGGNGGLLTALLVANPGLSGLLYDRGHVVAGASALLEAAGVGSRCRVEAGDFFERVPAGGDVYVLCQILHDWDDARAGAILRGCRAAMAADARLVVVERVLPELGEEGAAADPVDFLTDMHMMAVLSGRERTASEFQGLLAEAGFQLRAILTTRSPYRVIQAEAVPIG
ncbi:MAG: methyltransferase [Geminicoccaceae bacterium]